MTKMKKLLEETFSKQDFKIKDDELIYALKKKYMKKIDKLKE